MIESIDCEVWDEHGLMGVRDSRLLEFEEIINTPRFINQIFTSPSDQRLSLEEKKEKIRTMLVYEGIISGNKDDVERSVSDDVGRKVIIIPTE